MKKLLLIFVCTLLGSVTYWYTPYWYTPNLDDIFIIESLETLFEQQHVDALISYEDIISDAVSTFDGDSQKWWYAQQLSYQINEIIANKMLGSSLNNVEEVEDKEAPFPLPILEDKDVVTLMNHIPAEVADSEVILLEFTDLECPFCQRFSNEWTLEKVVDLYPDADYTTLAFPLAFHPLAEPAAQAMACIHKHAWYEKAVMFKDKVFEMWLKDRWVIFDAMTDMRFWIEGYADIANCIVKEETERAVNQQFELWKRMWVTWTPTTVLFHVPTKSFYKVVWAVQAASFYEPLDAFMEWDWDYFDAQKKSSTSPWWWWLVIVDEEAYEIFLENIFIHWPEDAPITIIEFSDMQCQFCQKHANAGTLNSIVDSYDWKVNTIFAHFPLWFHQNAQKAAEAVECAGSLWGQEWFQSFKDAFFKVWWDANLESAYAVAQQVWLDIEAFRVCVEGWQHAQKVIDQMAFWRSLWVTWTPWNVVIDNRSLKANKVSWAQPVDAFDDPIQKFLAQ